VPLLHRCSHAGCPSLTLGAWCVEHEPPHRLKVLVVGADPDLVDAACAGATQAWPDAEVVSDARGLEPMELAFAHSPDVIVLARNSASPDVLAEGLVLEGGLRSVRVVVFASVPGQVLVPA
jgi:AmiR/NasT family two-component response regulator